MARENTCPSETSNQMIRLNPFRFLGEKKCSSICPKKSTENSIQMVSAPSLYFYNNVDLTFRGNHMHQISAPKCYQLDFKLLTCFYWSGFQMSVVKAKPN